MQLNPFKESNLYDLQKNIRDFFNHHFSTTVKRLKEHKAYLMKKGRERITVMFIPHSEKRIVNFHISKFVIFGFSSFIIVTVSITSIIIINHSSTIKEVSKLKLYGTDSKVKIKQYKEEINKLYTIFQNLKPEITYLYSLSPANDVDSLWAKGGVSDSKSVQDSKDPVSPPLEVLNIEEMERELKITKSVLRKIKAFLETRKKVLENTPSLWPVEGYILASFGERKSPYDFRTEFHRGVDIAAFPGAEIRATAPGKVESIRWDQVLGLTITIEHKYGFLTCYSHCQRVSVEPNQNISKGEVIGYVGRTGRATRHLCFYQIRIGTEYVDPLPYLNKLTR